jgi:glycosyltransferase involved in cell wall biosynthesis
LKVIFIIPFPPTYESFNDSSIKEDNLTDPYQINSKGEKVFFFRQDWGGIIGEHVMQAANTVDWEVWRPDFRADKVLSHRFENNLVCKSFPAENRMTLFGITPVKVPWSRMLVDCLASETASTKYITILMPTTVDFSKFLYARISRNNPRILFYHFLDPEFLIPGVSTSWNPIKAIHRTMINHQKAVRMNLINNLQVLSEELQKDLIVKYPAKKIMLAKIGIDLSFWVNIISREQARESLGISSNTFLFLLSQRLVPEYQVDKWIQSLVRVKDRDFCCIITGAGKQDYVEWLKSLTEKSGLSQKVKLVGFVSNEILRTYITACDCFVNPCRKSAGSTGSIYAMHMGRLVMHTDSGVACDIMLKFNAGIIADPIDYESWTRIIIELLDRKSEFGLVPSEYIDRLFNWETCAQQWLDAINSTQGN